MENPQKPEAVNQTPEVGAKPEATPEVPAASEQIKPQAPPSHDQAAKKKPPVTPVSTPQPVDGAIPAAASPGPALADDVDVIEKEWVDKAQEIVKKTEGDPHAEEDQVEDLQYDYLKKRYGIDVNHPEEK